MSTAVSADRFGRWLSAHRVQLRQGVRMTVAGLMALALGDLFGMPRSYWAVLTAVLVTQASLGGSIRASVDRLIGTIAGALYGGAVALAIPHESTLGGVLALGLAIAPLALASALSASFRIAPITAIIVLLIPPVVQTGVMTSALERIYEIIFGCLVGLACSMVVLPSRAHRLVCEAAASIGGLLAELVRLELRAPGDAAARAAIQALQDRIRAALGGLETVAGEAREERRTYLAAPVDPEPLLRTLLRLRHDLVMVARATVAPLPAGAIAARLQPRLDAFAEAAATVLLDAAEALRKATPAPRIEPVQAARDDFSAAIEALRQEGLTRTLPGDAVERLFALGFALDQLSRDLGDFAERSGEPAQAGG
ncbi:MAG: FUSC family protein [Caulobacteraceae bacterium]|nr:FUSC family protein [Caulobacteraceae bacterium]